MENNIKKLKIEKKECVNVILVYLILVILQLKYKKLLKNINKKKDLRFYGDHSKYIYLLFLVGLVVENHGMNQVVHYNNIMDH